MSYNVSSLNKVMLIGRLGADPDLTYTPNGTAKVNFSIATSVKWKDKDGNTQEKTEWHRCLAWAKSAEIMGEWLKKGQLVYVEGKLQTRQWEQDGVKKYMTEVVVDEFTMLGSKSGNGGSSSSQSEPADSESDSNTDPHEDDDDDLPF